MNRRLTKLTSMLGVALVVTALASAPAEARRGGSFGSRGARTYQAIRPTQTSPQATAPVQRSMTPDTPGAQAQRPLQANPMQQQQRRGGFLGGLGGGLLGGLVAGGLLGMMLGHGWGGGFGAGMLNTLMQIALIGGAIFLVMALFRRRQQPAAPAGYAREAYGAGSSPFGGQGGYQGGGYQQADQPRTAYTPVTPQSDIELDGRDRDAFERLLTEVQDAFGREDYGALRERTTPEIMSYLSEELSQNAVQGRRNQVSNVRLLQADLAEAWREGDQEYATAALRYESIDVMRDRQTGQVVEGDASRPTETVELWTFVRPAGGPWKLSAIQEA